VAVGSVDRAAPKQSITAAMVRKWQEDELKAGSPPCINLYGLQGPPKGHRADCHPSQIPTKNCSCARIKLYKKSGWNAVAKLMGW
jgi:hypothetical protein